jgi:hypothetical protein
MPKGYNSLLLLCLLVAFTYSYSIAGINPHIKHPGKTIVKKPHKASINALKVIALNSFLEKARVYYNAKADTLIFNDLLPVRYAKADSFGRPERKRILYSIRPGSISIDTNFNFFYKVILAPVSFYPYKLFIINYYVQDSSASTNDTFFRSALIALNVENIKDIKFLSGPFLRPDPVWSIVPRSFYATRAVVAPVVYLQEFKLFCGKYKPVPNGFSGYPPDMFNFSFYHLYPEGGINDHSDEWYLHNFSYIRSRNRRFLIFSLKACVDMKNPQKITLVADMVWDNKGQKYITL